MTDLILGLVMLALPAIFVFEVVKYEYKISHQVCICKHLRKDHVQPGDYDCKVYIDGAEFDPWKCRLCRCRKFICQ